MNSATIKLEGITTEVGLAPKVFSTGRTGFFTQGKVVDGNGNRYQMQVQMVKIEPKSAEPTKATKK